MILNFDFDLDLITIKVHELAKYINQRTFSLKVTIWTKVIVQIYNRLTILDGLKL